VAIGGARRTGGPRAGAWGMNLQAPAPSKHQPWYTHWSRPLSSMRPSESGARRCGQASSNTRHSPAPRSYQATTLSPSTVLPCGAPGSRSHTGAKGYHWSSQSNSSCPDGDGDGASSVRGVSAATVDADSRAARRRRDCAIRAPPLRLLDLSGAAAVARGSDRRETRATERRERVSMARRRAAGSAATTGADLARSRELVAVVWRESWARGSCGPAEAVGSGDQQLPFPPSCTCHLSMVHTWAMQIKLQAWKCPTNSLFKRKGRRRSGTN
jgi:hypothetical protein